MVSTAFLLGAWLLMEVVENKWASSLPWTRHSTGRATFMWKTGDPDTLEIATLKQMLTYRPKHSNATHFLVNEG